MFNQNQGLPVDPFKQQFQFMNVNPNMPPYVPSIVAPAQSVQQYMAYISGILAIKVQQNAQQNPLRMFLFNMAAQNGFQNQYFDSMAIMAIRLTAYVMAVQRANIESAADSACSTICDYYAAANVRSWPALDKLIDDQGVRNGVYQTVQEFDAVTAELDRFNTPANTGMGMGGGAISWSGNSGGSSFTGGSSYASGVTTGSTPASSFSTALTSHTGTNAGTMSQWGAAAMAEQQAAPVATVEQAAPKAEPVQETLPAHTFNWRPNLLTEPYFYAYNPSEWDARLMVQADGTTTPDYHRIDNTAMEYDKHRTPSALGKLPSFLDLSSAAKTMERIGAGIAQLNGELIEDDVNENVTTVKTTVCDEWLMANSEAGAWMQASLKRLQLTPGDDGLPGVYRVYTRVVDAVLTDNDETLNMDMLLKCKSFTGLRERMHGLGGELSMALFNAINERMTNLINRKIQMELGLRKVTIDSFYDDIGDTIDYFDKTKQYGPVIKSAFLKNQEFDIAVTLQQLSKETAAAEADVILAGMKFTDSNRPNISFLSTNYSLTYLDCLSWELNVEFGGDIPVKLAMETVPMFYHLVKAAFEDADNLASKSRTLAIGRVMMRTKDGRVFECTRGALADEAYLITLVK